MNEGRVIPWRPKVAAPPPPTRPPRYAWSVVKQTWQIDCVVEEGERLDWALRVFINNRWFFRCEFPTWVLAVDAAELKYAQLSSAGWTPAHMSAIDDPAGSSLPAPW